MNAAKKSPRQTAKHTGRQNRATLPKEKHDKHTSAEQVLLPAEGFVRRATVLKIADVSSGTWDNWIKAGHAPKPMKIGPRCVAWRVEDIRQWIANAAESANDAQA